ncbi:nickel pincer cofactor biosynthesis protein LarB [Vibrio breoganii]|uniref:nickel pincer cofactor biosynthesis protein LarB n=1 Tax=Vibrio breoganii TaxID=553239 RepID=UPI000C815706|nr:nickel pincer cofactor biosynthesis protein LarB [Vibrio breoganii]PMO32024.1 hypothetical protein BCT12_16985 [Vibrio breoganii]
MSGIIIDFERKQRCGVEEAIFCQSKTSEQIDKIIEIATEKRARLLFTRLGVELYQELSTSSKSLLNYCDISCTAVLGGNASRIAHSKVAVVSGGSSDTAICHEIKATLHYHGFGCDLYEDVGVSALWRLTERLEQIQSASIVIAVAGMEAALPTVLSGMIANPIIAVPTSVGYGVSEGGHLALNACLGSCAAGLMTVNIDNGFGAACAAIKLLNTIEK